MPESVKVEELEIIVSANVQKALPALKKVMDSYNKALAAMKAQMKAQMPGVGKQVEAIQKQMQAAAKTVQATAKTTAQAVEKTVQAEKGSFEKLSRSLELVNAQIENQQKLYKNLLAQSKTASYESGEDSAKYLAVEKKLLAAEQAMNRLKDKAEAAAEKLQAAIDLKISEQPFHEIAEALDTISSSAKVANQGVVDLAAELSNLKARQAELSKMGIGLGFSEFDENERKISDYTAKLKEYQNTIKNAGKETSSTFGRASPIALAFAKALEKIKENSRKAAEQIRKAERHTNQFVQRIKSMLTSMLLYRSVAMLMQSIRAGMQNLTQASEQANAVLSSLSSSFLYVKNSVAAAVMPALQALEPVIVSVTNALANLFNMIAAVTSRLFGGATVFTKAKKVQQNYAASLSGTGSAAKDAKDEIEGLTASFDELNVIGKESSSGGGSGGGGSAAPGDMFETVEIPQDALSFADRLANLFERLKAAAQPTIEALSRLKAALEPLKSFTFKALQDFYEHFLKPVGSWVLGEGLPRFIDALTDGLQKINLERINEALVKFWDALAPFTTNVGEGLLWLWENVLVPLGTWTINEVIPRFLEILAAAIEVLNSTIEALAPKIQSFFDNVLKPLAEWSGGVITDFLDKIIDGLQKLNELAQGNTTFKEFIESLDGSQIVLLAIAAAIGGVAAALAIYNAVAAASAAVTALLGNPFLLVGAAIAVVIAAVGLLIKHWDELNTYFNGAFDSILGLVESAKNSFQEWFQAIIDGWNSHIKPVLQNFAEKFQEVVERHVIQMVENVIEFWGKLSDALKLFWNKVFSPLVTWIINNAIPHIAAALEFAGGVFNTLLATVSDVIGGIFKALSGVIDFLTGVFTRDWEKAWDGVKGIFKGVFNGIVGLLEGAVNLIIKGVNFMISKLNTIHIDLPDWIPAIGGKSFGINLSKISDIEIPRLTQGGVLTKPSLVNVAEYAGASSNPEIVAPQSIMYDTVVEANAPMIQAMWQMARFLSGTIEDNRTSVQIGDKELYSAVKRGGAQYQKLTGQPAF